MNENIKGSLFVLSISEKDKVSLEGIEPWKEEHYAARCDGNRTADDTGKRCGDLGTFETNEGTEFDISISE